MTTKIILISHALTQWNILGKIQGHTDLPLNDQGRQMARLLAKILAQETIHAIYTSDLKRAWQTAMPVSEQKNLDIFWDIRLREGRSKDQEKSNTYPTLPFSKEVETKEDLFSRMDEALSDIGRCHDNQTVLVVSHGGALDIFIRATLEKNNEDPLIYRDIRMALNRIQYNCGGWEFIDLNQDYFL